MQCTGNCCERFVVGGGQSYDKIQLEALNNPFDMNLQRVVEIIVPIGRTEGGSDLFTCTMWDKNTRRCTDYENRPAMCRKYPYAGQICSHCGYAEPSVNSAGVLV